MRLLRISAALWASTALCAAQTTHDVVLFANTFVPDDLTIQVGDTVRWDWVTGYHDVQSGVGGVPDGLFGSDLTANPNFFYEFTFDQAFVDANPMVGGVYDYYCTTHLPQMTGRITVQDNATGTFEPYGFDVNPLGSLFAGGSPNVGGTAEFTLLNPVTAPAGPGFGALLLSTLPDLNFPGGTSVPGFGMAQGSPGELLISFLPPDPVLSLGPVDWLVNEQVDILLPIPNNPNLVGQVFYVQGALVDVTKPEPVGVTTAVVMTIG